MLSFIRLNSLEKTFDVRSIKRYSDWLHIWWKHKDFSCGKCSHSNGCVWHIENLDAASSLCSVPQCNVSSCNAQAAIRCNYAAWKKKGLLVKVVIYDQGSNNVSLSRMLIHSLHEPCFTVNNCKLYFMFDIPHLIKCTRNNLRKHKLTIGSEVVDWAYIETFYKNTRKSRL